MFTEIINNDDVMRAINKAMETEKECNAQLRSGIHECIAAINAAIEGLSK